MSFAPAKIEQTGPDSYFVSHGDDRSLHVEFYMEAVHQAFESEKAGMPKYKDIPFIRIRTPGVTGNTIERPVKMQSDGVAPSDPQRFPRQWDAFQNQREQAHDGLPVEQWAVLTKSQVLELKASRLFTVEQVAGLPDSSLNLLGLNGRRLRDMAKALLDQGEKNAAVSAITAENERLKADVEMMKHQIAELSQSENGRKPRKKENEND